MNVYPPTRGIIGVTCTKGENAPDVVTQQAEILLLQLAGQNIGDELFVITSNGKLNVTDH